MNRILRALVATGFAVLVVACASKPHSGYVRHQNLPLFDRMVVEVRLPTEEVGVAMSPTYAGLAGPGLVGVAVGMAIAETIDGIRLRRAERRLAAIRDRLAEHDYRALSLQLVKLNLDRGVLSPQMEFVPIYESQATSQATNSLTTRRRFLVVEQEWYFLPDFRLFRVEIRARIVDRIRRKGRSIPHWENELYANIIQYEFPLPRIEGVYFADERAQAWSDMDAADLDAMLREGIAGSIELLAYDLAGAPDEQILRQYRADAFLPVPEFLDGKIVRDDGRRLLVRNRDKSLRSIPVP
ncbi:MAG TPA: hypothetical protein PKZ76_01665 [Xanthomonadaceae bacterium]|nr:hypothetical protein [Xanthomonadaceae bacterium]